MNKEYIGVDLGGSSFNMGRVIKGMLVDEVKRDIDGKADEAAVLMELTSLLDKIITPDVEGIGIGVPGIVDPVAGIIYDIQNIPAWKEVHLKEILENRYDVPVALNNDANCFALAEKMFGKGREYRNFVGVTIGTGLGMGVIINNQLYNGVMCGAGEIGMLPYLDGIVEEYAASFFFTRNYGENARTVHENALKDQPRAIEAFHKFGHHLGEAIKMILFMYAPEVVILGGSIAKAHKFFETSMKESIANFAYPRQTENLRVLVSTHPNIAILGASALVMDLTS